MRYFQNGRLVSATLFTLLGFGGGIGLGFYLWNVPAQKMPGSTVQPVQAEIASKPASVRRTPTPFRQLEQEVIANLVDRDFVTALDLLMEADLIASSEAEVRQLSSLLDETVKQRVDQLTALQQFGEIDALYEDLTLSMPERAEYYFLLAQHRIDMDNPEGALPVLAQIENHHQLGGRAREMIDLLSAEGNNLPLAAIPLERSGDQYLVQATVDDSIEVTLLLDTGASMTILAPGILRNLGYALDGRKASFSTANGVVQAPVVSVQSLSLGDQRVGPIVIGAIGLSRGKGKVDGLLGMDYLSGFEFSLDQSAEMLNLHSTRGE